MSGHIHSEASSHECRLVRALEYATPRLLDYSPEGLYRESALLGTWADNFTNSAQGSLELGDHHLWWVRYVGS